MANLKTSIILDSGINAIHNTAWGSHFALRYFLPIYDPRIDNDIHSLSQELTSGNGVEPLQLSATLDSTHQYANLEGEKLFNPLSSYLQSTWGLSQNDIWKISSSRNYVTCASPNIGNVGYGYTTDIGYDSTSISGTSQQRGVRANLINDYYSLSTMLSANTLTADTSGGFTGTDIGTVPTIAEPSFTLSGGTNVNAVSLLYPTASFSSVAVSAGSNLDAGRYAVKLTTEHGDFRFNKIVFFAVSLNSDGSVDTSILPVPFSVSVFEGTVIKTKTTDDNSGLLWEGVFQLVFQRDPTLNNLTNLMVSNWTDTSTEGFELSTANKVSIYNGFETKPNTNAKLTVIGSGTSGFPVLSGTPQLALGYDNDNISYLYTTSASTLELSAYDINLLSSSAVNIDSKRFNVDINGGSSGSITLNQNGSFVLNAYNSSTIFVDDSLTIDANSGELALVAGNDRITLYASGDIMLQSENDVVVSASDNFIVDNGVNSIIRLNESDAVIHNKFILSGNAYYGDDIYLQMFMDTADAVYDLHISASVEAGSSEPVNLNIDVGTSVLEGYLYLAPEYGYVNIGKSGGNTTNIATSYVPFTFSNSATFNDYVEITSSELTFSNASNTYINIPESTVAPSGYSTSYIQLFTSADPSDGRRRLYYVNAGEHFKVSTTQVN